MRTLSLSLTLLPLLAGLLTGLAPAQDQRLLDPEEASQRRLADERTLVVYDVADLTGESTLPAAVVQPTGTIDAVEAERVLGLIQERELALARVHEHAETLREAVAGYMDPELKNPEENLRLLNDGALLLLGGQAQHAWTRQFLELQRSTTGMLDIQVSLLRVPAGLLKELGVEMSAKIFETEEPFEALQAAFEKHEQVEILNTPRLLVFPRQRASVSVINQVAYIRDFELVVIEPDDVEIADPIVDVIDEGVTLEMRAVPIGGGIFGIDVEVKSATLQRPIPTRTLRIGAHRSEVTIGLPEVTTVGVKSQLALRSGAVAVLITPDQSRDEDLVVVLRMRHISDAELGQEVGVDHEDGKRKK